MLGAISHISLHCEVSVTEYAKQFLDSLRPLWLAFYLAYDISDCSYSGGPQYCPNLQLSLNFKYVQIPLCSNYHLMAAIPDQLEIAECVCSRAASLPL